MRFLAALFGCCLAAFAVLWLGIGGVNQLAGGLTDQPNDWYDVLWGIVRAWLFFPVFWIGTSLVVAGVFNAD